MMVKTSAAATVPTKTAAAADYLEFHCPVEATVSVIGGKYKAIILYHLAHDGVLRFSQLQRLIPRATPKMLTQQLRELESDGIVHREVYPVVPPKTEYSLTEFGQTLCPVVDGICDWGRMYIDKVGARLAED